jgi:hypothetical protein
MKLFGFMVGVSGVTVLEAVAHAAKPAAIRP